MVKKYVNEDNLQIAMTEYNNLGKGDAVITQYDDIVGRVTLDFDNENGNGEQVYAKEV
ncbi:hypothetical protein ACTGJ2_01265 [Streptococcus suis]|uniref:hypothetical protein n=1 Tax=Streptococcus suis TaxID=1307 RepID=UPI000424C55D|nr:hypothetical protein [Streptococcus suis]MBM7319169.1 hypothetical protein [Streptococcus suis]MBO4132125.1 hypothetical protein [Streptococcus suis]MBO4133966.1 hypothetical protein [Streptococcus suis]MBY4964711.1 hypothetical protein [Streptococcus suis]NQK13511.1 hypothetical protein [Streptococcus suis]